MKHRLHWIFAPYMAPADDGSGGSGGGGADRGDDWTPTDDDAAEQAKALEKAEAEKQAAKEAEDAQKAAEDAEKAKGGGEGGAGEGGDEGKDGKKDTRLPLSRHTEILSKERERREAVERELAALKQGQAVARTNEDIAAAETKVAGMEKEYLDLLAKGEVEKAAAKMAEIRRTEREIVQASAKFDLQAAEARAYERVKYDTTVERLEEAFPSINPDHESYDKELVGELLEMRDAYTATGRYNSAEALQKAVKVLLKPTTAKQEKATEVDVRVDKEDLAKATAEERKKAAVEKALGTKQPANPSTLGQDSDKAGGVLKGADVIKMDQKSFAQLAEADLAKLRGDTL